MTTALSFATIADMSSASTSGFTDGQVAIVADVKRGGVFKWSSAGSGMPANGGTIFSSSGSSQWLRVDADPLNVCWFGAVGDGVADDYPAFKAAHDVLANDDVLKLGGRIYIPRGFYYLSDTLEIQCTIQFFGDGNHENPNNQSIGGFQTSYLGSVILFAVSKSGLVFNNYNTNGGGTHPGTPYSNTTQSILADLVLQSKGGTGSFDGVWMRQPIIIRNVSIIGFPRYGLRIEGNSAGIEPVGQPNLWQLDNVRCLYNGSHGAYIAGSDANAGIALRLNCTLNGGDGIHDNSLIGNTYVATHCSSNGTSGAGNVAIWTRDSQPTTIIGAYVEFGGKIHLGDQTTLIGNTASQNIGDETSLGFALSAGAIYGAPLHYVNTLGSTSGGTSAAFGLGYRDLPNTVVTLGSSDDSATMDAWKLKYSSVGANKWWSFEYANSPTHTVLQFPTAKSAARFFSPAFPNGFYIGGDGISPLKAQTNAAAIPTSGTWEQGDFVWNTAPTAGGVLGWICITGGTFPVPPAPPTPTTPAFKPIPIPV